MAPVEKISHHICFSSFHSYVHCIAVRYNACDRHTYIGQEEDMQTSAPIWDILRILVKSLRKKSRSWNISCSAIGIFYILGLVMYPAGWGAHRVQKLCGLDAAPFFPAECHLGKPFPFPWYFTAFISIHLMYKMKFWAKFMTSTFH